MVVPVTAGRQISFGASVGSGQLEVGSCVVWLAAGPSKLSNPEPQAEDSSKARPQTSPMIRLAVELAAEV